MFKLLSEEEISERKAKREAEFNALPLIEQIRIVVREEVANLARVGQKQPPFGSIPIYRHPDATDEFVKP